MNLRTLDERVDLYLVEAAALQSALQAYLYHITVRSAQRPVPLDEAMSIKPMSKVFTRVSKLLEGNWTKAARGNKRPVQKSRLLRLEYDELLKLNALYAAGQLTPILDTQVDPLQVALGKVNQKAQNLSPLFQV